MPPEHLLSWFLSFHSQGTSRRRQHLSRLSHLSRRKHHKGFRHWVTLVILLVAGYFAGRALEDADFLNGVRLKLYGIQMKAYIHPQDQPQNTMVLMIRDDDYWGDKFQGRSPLNREELGSILHNLQKAGVKRVVLDVDLRLPQYPGVKRDPAIVLQDDLPLVNAIKDFCDPAKWPSPAPVPMLVLGTSVLFESEGNGSSDEGYYTEVPSIFTDNTEPEKPIAHGAQTRLFRHDLVAKNNPNCPAKGYLQLPTDLRQIPEDIVISNGAALNSLSLETVRLLSQESYTNALSHAKDSFYFSHFLKPEAFGYSTVSGPYALNSRFFSFTLGMLKSTEDAAKVSPEKPQPLLESLGGKTVLIGGDWHTRAYNQGPAVDQFDSPLGPMPGVFLHANYIEAFLDQRGTSHQVPDFVVKITEWSLLLFLLILGHYEIEGGWKWAWFASAILTTGLVVYALLLNVGIFMDFFVPICILIAHALLDDFFALLDEIKRLRKRFKEEIDAT